MQRLVGHFIAFLQGNPNLPLPALIISEEKSCNLFHLGLNRKIPA